MGRANAPGQGQAGLCRDSALCREPCCWLVGSLGGAYPSLPAASMALEGLPTAVTLRCPQ